ncbi:hypothetical protein [Niastella yeongjuensis]|nr:hypothetical protein [Niastella yeongjuensis]SEN03030.1 hypothetical protein SAMN05660816_00016 [Niastella yeongjuensis]
MDEGRENNMCADEGGLPLIKKVLYGVLIDNEKIRPITEVGGL